MITTPAKTTLIAAGSIKDRSSWESVLQTKQVTAANVIDGLSNPYLYFEDGGRPTKYGKGGKLITGTVSGSRWADVDNYFHVHDTCGSAMTNCHNGNEIFSFHTGDTVISMADGSVHFESEGISPEVFVSLFTASAGDISNVP